jgi:hypothetical protein
MTSKREDIINARGGGPKHDSLFKQAIPGIQRGTQRGERKFPAVLKRGCYFGPPPCREMSWSAKECDPSRCRGGRKRLKWKLGTNIVENNKLGTNIVENNNM